ncbi:MAG: DUF2158 domain-containing protein [Caulobacter sp.]|nr:DUF2158 domain-containing protein [Caulobacter sp.]
MFQQNNRRFSAKAITRVARADSFHDAREPALRIGDVVQLNSGGPAMLVVDFEDDSVVAAWRTANGVEEVEFPKPCVHRVLLA